MAYIYKITNTINGKIYIGQTVQNIKNRWRQHINDAYTESKCAHLHAAIRKYGEDNFNIEVVELCPQELLDEREIYWIKEFDTVNTGYNLTSGGRGTNREIDQSLLEELWDQGLSTKQIADQVGLTRQWVRQRLLTYENYSSKEGCSRGAKIQGKSKCHSVSQFDVDGNFIKSFESIKEATKVTGINNISRSCREGTKAGGYYWKYND